MSGFLKEWWFEIFNFTLLLIPLLQFYYKKLFLNFAFLFVGATLFVTLIVEIISTIYVAKGYHNLVLYNVLAPLQLLFLSLLFTHIINDQRIKKLIAILIPLVVICFLVVPFISNSENSYPSYSLIVKNAILVILSLFYFRELLNSESDIRLSKYPLFWLVSGILIISVSSLVIEGCMNFIIKSDPMTSERFFYAPLFLNYLFYLIIVKSFSLVKMWKT